MGHMLVPGDVPEEPDELEAVFDFEVLALGLTYHQRLMLEPVEARMQTILVPGSIGAGVANIRLTNRKNKWSSKLRGHVAGSMANKWVSQLSSVGGLQDIQELSTGRAKVGHAQIATEQTQWAAAKQKAKATMRSKAKQANNIL